MQQFTQNLLEYLGWSINETLALAVLLVLAATVIVLFISLPIAGILTFAERKVAGHAQSRMGPNRVLGHGFFQWAADGIKLVLKEDIIPAKADQLLFRYAPYLVVMGFCGTLVCIPFADLWIGADLNVGMLYVMAIGSLATAGIIMSGWASNNKWSALGGLRAAAQIISYEIPTGLGVLVVVLMSQSLSLQTIVERQGGGWGIFGWNFWPWNNVFATIASFIYFTASLAEINRTPFDIPEAESELVSGYNTEYSGIRFGMFFVAEFGNVFVLSAFVTALFFGGWHVPFIASWLQEVDWSFLPLIGHFCETFDLPYRLAGATVFMLKATFFMFFILFLRWTLPRVRVDQLMEMNWEYLVPIGIFSVLGTALWMLV
ncbi:NADH-quinone oxidoreductase subunit NuoH [bacterium]|nr:NADH-quinone oxidoreductase subunit NuoH [bacterium]